MLSVLMTLQLFDVLHVRNSALAFTCIKVADAPHRNIK